jgi:D-alanyl-D-alanine carboxypeptidase/D-alanyl-D-alanine-endopeptidase (penicillin-binding protein 4)
MPSAARIGLLGAMFALASSAADLPERLAALLESAPAAVRGVAGIHVVDLASGTPLFAYNENQLFLPASNMKLFTASLAMSRLGPGYRFETRLIREPSGSLALIGAGDPSMSGRVYPYDAQAAPLPASHAIEELADQAVASGLRQVEGDVVGDDRRYIWSPYPESWTADDAQHDYGAPVSALTFNDNAVTITVRPGARAGDLARVELDPPFEYLLIDNRVTTVGVNGEGTLRVTRVPGSRQVLLSGTINARTTALRAIVAVDDPALFAAHALYDALLRRGVAVRGRPVARHRIGQLSGPEDGVVLAVRRSPPLSELLRTTIKVSQNLHAELLLREVGFVRQGQGTVEAGLREMRVAMTELRIAPAAWTSEDASGLARNDEVTPRAVTQLLTAMMAGEQRDLWFELFPVGGQDGTLSARLCCTAGTLSIRAKTGSLSRAVALSGYADSPTNGRLAFSILVNNFAASATEVRAWVDRLASALLE